jgi:hypothetical protein
MHVQHVSCEVLQNKPCMYMLCVAACVQVWCGYSSRHLNSWLVEKEDQAAASSGTPGKPLSE